MTAVYSVYATLNAICRRLGFTVGADASRDTLFAELLRTASRWIDHELGRHIGPRVAARYYTAECGRGILIDDLLSVTALATDDAGDRNYSTTWAATDYDLFPFNHPPYQRITVAPTGHYNFPVGAAKGVKITGVWGFADDTLIGTTAAEQIDSSETAIDVTSGAALEVMCSIRIDAEDMLVTAIATNTITAIRAINGTTAAAHDNLAAIDVLDFPHEIKEACLWKTIQLFKRRDVVGRSTSGKDALGQLQPPSDAYIWELLAPFRRIY